MTASLAGHHGVKGSFDASMREDLVAHHPVTECAYTLPTPMMQRTYALVRELVWTRRTGMVFYGANRMGKTRCIRAVKELLAQEFPNVYVTLLTTTRSDRPRASHIFRLILGAEEHALSNRADADILFGNAVADIRVKANRIGATQYVLLIDEMQLLNDTDLQQLVCFHNQLELKNIRMTAISFAQPEILHRRTSLIANKARQIIGRFLTDTLRFDGCASEHDLGVLLRFYDSHSEYPEGSGITYTQFYFPVAYAQGFRMEQCRPQLWDSLRTAAATFGDQGVPMEHLCLSINYLLLSHRREDNENFSLSQLDIDGAVSASKLQKFCEDMN